MTTALTVQDLVEAVEGAVDATAAQAPAVVLCQAVKAQGSGEPDTAASLALLCAVKARCVPWAYACVRAIYVRDHHKHTNEEN